MHLLFFLFLIKLQTAEVSRGMTRRWTAAGLHTWLHLSFKDFFFFFLMKSCFKIFTPASGDMHLRAWEKSYFIIVCTVSWNDLPLRYVKI